jgi:hypothetical protein
MYVRNRKFLVRKTYLFFNEAGMPRATRVQILALLWTFESAEDYLGSNGYFQE